MNGMPGTGSRTSNDPDYKSSRESGEDSEDECEILEESPCGRWLKRREEVSLYIFMLYFYLIVYLLILHLFDISIIRIVEQQNYNIKKKNHKRNEFSIT